MLRWIDRPRKPYPGGRGRCLWGAQVRFKEADAERVGYSDGRGRYLARASAGWLRGLGPALWMLALLVGLAATAGAVPSRAATPRVSVDVDGADLGLVVKLVARQMGADVFLGAEVQGEVTLHVRDTSVHQVLSGLLRPRSLSYRFLGNSLVVAREETLRGIPRDILGTRPGSPWRASLNYSRADLGWVVQIMAREMGKTLILGKKVSGKVTAVARDVPIEGALALILRLQSPPYGYRLTREALVVDLPGQLPGPP